MCDGLASVLTAEPSPKFQLYEAMVPSLSTEPAELKSTTSGALTPFLVPLATATGAWFTVLAMLTVAVAVAPSLSVTVSVAV